MADKVAGNRAQIELLSRQLADIDSQLQSLTTGDVDAVIGPDGRSFLLRQSQVRLLQSEEDLRDLAQQLQQERGRLVAAQAVAKIGSWSLDLDSRAIYWSEEMYRIVELDPETVPPDYDRFLGLVHPEDRNLVLAQLKDVVEQQGDQLLEHRLLLAHGKVKFVEQRWQVVRDEGGRAVRAFGTCQDTTERRVAEEALRQSQAQLSMVTRLSRLGAWSLTLGSPNPWWSDEVCAIHEVEPGTSPSIEQAFDFFPSEWRPVVQRAIQECSNDGTPFDLETEIVSARGRRVWVRSIGEAIRDTTGRVVRIQGALQDLSDRKRIENEVGRLAKRLTTTLESLTVSFLSVDHEWCITYFNGEAERIFKRSRQDVLGRNLWDTFPCLVGSVFEIVVRKAAATGQSQIRDHTLPFSELWFRATVFPSEEGVAAILRDITSEHEASLQLKLLQASVEQLHDIILITDADILDEPGPRIRFANEALLRVTGYSPAEAIGRSPRFLQGPDTDRRELDRIRSALSRFEAVHAELLNYKKGGEPYWVEVDIVPVAATEQGSAHFVAVKRDITERKRAEDALRQLNQDLENRVLTRTAELSAAREEAESASRAKSSFLAAMSHEIRTPMNGVIGLIDVLAQSSLLPSQVEMVRLVRDSAESLLGIIDDILDFSKIEAGKLQIVRQPICLERIVEKVSGLLATVARKQNVALTAFVDPDIPEFVLGDELRLRQVLINLLGNAIKFSSGLERPGRVSIRMELVERAEPKSTIRLTISDNGVGIDRKTLDGLFQPFSQADASTTRRFGGTGLGLAISKMLVNLQGGDIGVKSRPGEGATFIVDIPLEPVPESAPRARGEPALDGLSCVIIGADPQLVADISRYLSHAGAKVHAEGPTEAPSSDGSIWLILPDASDVDRRACNALAAERGNPGRFITLRFAEGTGPWSVVAGGPSLDLDTMTRVSLVRSVAAAAGRWQPAAQGEADHRASHGAEAVVAAPKRAGRVLVAEDIETNREVIRRQLNLLGLEADIAVDGRQALDRWRTGEFQLVLTDVRMPLMDGYAVARAIRAEEAGGRRTPIIALTANALPEEESKCLAAGMDGFLVKPITSARLKAVIDQWMPSSEPAGAAQSIADAAAGPVNLGVLTALIGDDPAGIQSVLGKFFISCSQMKDDLQGAIAARSATGVSDIMHKLKSGAFSIGATRLGELCVEVEEAADSGDFERIDALRPQLAAQLDAVLAYLEAALP